MTSPHATASSSGSSSSSDGGDRRRARAVPSSRLGRVVGFGGLGLGLVGGALSELSRRAVGAGTETASVFLTEANMDRVVSTMCRMRGAALKVGQIVSIQDNSFLPPAVSEMFDRVRDSADFMPERQLETQLSAELGPNWAGCFSEFDKVPFASASIGQVHRAVLASNGRTAAVKVQYPGVAESIDSDIDNLRTLLRLTGVMPRGLYMDNVLASARTELGWECDYEREARCAERFATLLQDEPGLAVPEVFREATTRKVLALEFMNGVPLHELREASQYVRDTVAARVLRLTLREVFEFGFMQTDPNFSNFLYNATEDRLCLLDFGASREFEDHFVRHYHDIIDAAVRGDRDRCAKASIGAGFLTGTEDPAMTEAHVQAVTILARPFSMEGTFDFATQDVSGEVRKLIPVMLQHRVAPPPLETYSLHRKMSGAFLVCAQLRANIACAPILADVQSAFQQRFKNAPALAYEAKLESRS